MFSRKRGGPKHVRTGDAPRSAALAQSMESDGTAPRPEHGPWDAEWAPDDVQRLDLGSLLIPAIDGVEVRVQANPDGVVEQVVLVVGESALQLGVFAAPRSEGIWGEVRGEIAEAMVADGVTAREIEGPYGVELVATVNTPQGPADVRFCRGRRAALDGPGRCSRARRPATAPRRARSATAWRGWSWSATTRPVRSARRCRCACPRRWPTRPSNSRLSRPARKPTAGEIGHLGRFRRTVEGRHVPTLCRPSGG